MSRVIKFRGYDLENKCWRYGFYYQAYTNGEDLIIEGGTFYNVEPESVGQFTGLTDCNGFAIYEGDIIQTPYDFNVPEYSDYDGSTIGLYRGAVYFRPSAGFIQNRVVKQEHDSDCHQTWRPHKILTRIVQSKCEVIGNIYEHPQLLDRSSESP